MLTTTSLIAIVTVIFCGGLTPPLLGLLKVYIVYSTVMDGVPCTVYMVPSDGVQRKVLLDGVQ